VSDQPSSPESPGRSATRRALIAAAIATGLGATGLALWSAIVSTDDKILPPASRWVAAFGFAVLWLWTAARAWVALFDRPAERRSLTGALYMSQLGKYVPGGGFVQISSMVAMSRSDTLGASRLALGLPIVGLSAVAAGGLALAGLSVADTTLSGVSRVFCLGGLAAVGLLWRPLMVITIGSLRRFIRRLPDPELVPAQRAILVSFGWTAASLGATSAGYAVLVEPLRDDRDVVSLALVFAVAWVAGFVVLPLPAGIGVREVVLIGLIGGGLESVVGASVTHRVINIVAELAMVGWHFVLRRPRSVDAGPT